jgi:peroxiredoxin
MIQVGQKVPDVKLKRATAEGPVDVQLADYLKGKQVVLFTLPGAFTGTCSKTHLPGYLAQLDALKAKGVDEVICASVNDVAVMRAWGEHAGALGKITMLADGNGDLARALGVAYDASAHLMGAVRARRAAFDVKDGVVTSAFQEDKPGEVTVSGAEACLARW